jgi:AraC-like DNA-binding protein
VEDRLDHLAEACTPGAARARLAARDPAPYRRGVALEMRHGSPHPALRGVVIRCAGFAQRAPAPVRFRELPCTHVPLVLDLAEGWTVAVGSALGAPGRRVGSFVAGLTVVPVTVEHPGRSMCLQVDLTPLGARRVLGIPMHQLAEDVVEVADVLGRAGAELVRCVGEAPGWAERFEIVDRFLLARLESAPPIVPEMPWALSRLDPAADRAPVGEVARALGWSHRRLISRFRDQVGLPPMAVARIRRFERLTAIIDAQPRPVLDWARVALECGWYDQAHLARDVRRLSGLTPTRLLAERVNFVQDLAGRAA